MLTPLDVENVEFPKRMFGGYDPDAVLEFLDDIVKTLVGHIDEKKKLDERVARLTEEVESFRAREKLVSESVQLAQETRDNVIQAAKKEAENILKEARLEEIKLKHELAGLIADREGFEFEFYGLLKGFILKLENRNPSLAKTSGSEGSSSLPEVSRLDDTVKDS